MLGRRAIDFLVLYTSLHHLQYILLVIVLYSSGSSIAKFPSGGFVVHAEKLTDQISEVLHGDSNTIPDVPIMGFYQHKESSSGRIVVYGDSNCIDSAHMERGE